MIELAMIASAVESDGGFGISQWLELGVIITTLVLVIVTAGLWWATAQVHRDEILKLSDNQSHANDNMTEVALAEIHAHRAEHMKRIRHQAKGKGPL